MNIEIKWINRTKNADSTTIYRSAEPFNKDDLPEPLAVINGDLESYLDVGLEPESVHYYRTKATKGNEEVISELMRMEALPYVGPGPQKLLVGDMEQGYFGLVPASEFINRPKLESAVPALKSWTKRPSVDESAWMKFAYKGKVLFIPTNLFYGSISWRDLYQAGLIYGRDDFGNDNGGGPDTNQLVTLRIQEQLFKVRTIVGDNEEKLGPHGDPRAPMGLRSNEFTDLLVASNTTHRGNGAKPHPIQTLNNELIQDSGKYLDLCADTYPEATSSGSKVLARCVGLFSGVSGQWWAAAASTAAYTNSITLIQGGSFTLGWRPVLEWVPE